MDRTEYLKMCQKVSVYKKIGGVITNLPDELKVRYKEITYYPVEYILSFKNDNPMHTAVLHDLKANSIIHAELEKVENYV